MKLNKRRVIIGQQECSLEQDLEILCGEDMTEIRDKAALSIIMCSQSSSILYMHAMQVKCCMEEGNIIWKVMIVYICMCGACKLIICARSQTSRRNFHLAIYNCVQV